MTALPASEPLLFDPYDYDFHEDPYPTYERLRREAPLHHNEVGDLWVLSRHADIQAALRDDVTFSNRMGVSLDASAWSRDAHRVMSFLALRRRADPSPPAGLGRLHAPRFAHNFLNNAVHQHGAVLAPALAKHWRELARMPDYKVEHALGKALNALTKDDPETAAMLTGGLFAPTTPPTSSSSGR